VEHARRRDPSQDGIAGLATEVARARAAEREPIEAALRELVAAEKDDEAEKKAAEVLARWPESEAARRALRVVEDHRRRAQTERLVAEADAAFAAGDTAAACAQLAQALAAARGPEREALERRVRQIEAAEHAGRRVAAVDRVRGLLSAADPRAGLLAYLELEDEELRDKIRTYAGSEHVLLLDAVGRGAPQARVDAVLALRKARAEVTSGEGEAALATLAPHLSLLDRVPELKPIAREAETRAAARRAARTGEDVASARAALAAGDAASALLRLDPQALRHLPEPEREAAAALRAEATALVARAEKIAKLGQLRAAGKLFEARRIAEELAADAGAEDRALWLAERRSIQEVIQRDFCVTVDDRPTPIDDRSVVMGTVTMWDAQRWIAADGRTMVMAQSIGRWLFLHVIDVMDRTVRARVSLRTPSDAGSPSVHVTDDVVWLLAYGGELLALSLDTWEVKLHRTSAEVVPPDTNVASSAFPLGDGGAPRFLWVAPFTKEWTYAARVIDLEQRRLGREVAPAERVADLPGAREPRILSFRTEALVLYEENGTAVSGGRIEVPGATPAGAALHPDGRSLVLLVQARSAQSPWAYAWTLVPFGGPPGPLHPIEDALACSPAGISRAGEAGLLAIQFHTSPSERALLVLGTSSGDLTPLYRVPMTTHVVLAQDPRGRKLFAVECVLGHLSVAEIGPTPPALPSWGFPMKAWIDHVLDLVSCLDYKKEDRAALRDLGTRVSNLTPANRATLIRNYQRQESPDVEYGFSVSTSLQEAGLTEEAERLFNWVIDRFPRHPEARVRRADRLAQQGRWAEVEALFDPTLDTAPRSAHFYHLLALARLHAGDPDAARTRLGQARSMFPAVCNIVALEELLSPPPDPPRPEGEILLLSQLAEDARAADRCFAASDPEGALAALSHQAYWYFGDVQLYARLAEGHLLVQPRSRREQLTKMMALVRFLEQHAEKDPRTRREMPIPGATWDRTRLDEIAARASAWLDRLGGGEGWVPYRGAGGQSGPASGT
jgi:hypothetical protein